MSAQPLVSAEQWQAYDAVRELAHHGRRAACYAPMVSMFFDTRGNVRACCVNERHLLGNVARERLDAIWNGRAAEALRRALERYDLSPGCEHCAWQIADGNFKVRQAKYHPVHALKYDPFPVSAEGELWPANLEFNLANTCNLECPMCRGELSSAIRARRDRLPPLPRAYGEEFFLDLRKYLHRAQCLQFLGGEPFLIQEHFRVWEMLIEDRLDVEVQITTNGTQWNARVQRVLDQLRVALNVSLDGVRPETAERLRAGLRWEAFLENFRRFHEYARSRGTHLGLNFSLMRQNWQELGEFLAWADDWGCPVSVCTVVDPFEFSLYTLDRQPLAQVVAELERQSPGWEAALRLNRPTWDNVLDQLRRRLELADHRLHVQGPWLVDAGRAPRQIAPAPEPLPAAGFHEVLADFQRWSGGGPVSGMVCDLGDAIVGTWPDGQPFLDIPPAELVGHPAGRVAERLAERWGVVGVPVTEKIDALGSDRLVRFPAASGAVLVRAFSLPRYDAAGRLAGTLTLGGWRAESSPAESSLAESAPAATAPAPSPAN